jgi:hypothetical protein
MHESVIHHPFAGPVGMEYLVAEGRIRQHMRASRTPAEFRPASAALTASVEPEEAQTRSSHIAMKIADIFMDCSFSKGA